MSVVSALDRSQESHSMGYHTGDRDGARIARERDPGVSEGTGAQFTLLGVGECGGYSSYPTGLDRRLDARERGTKFEGVTARLS